MSRPLHPELETQGWRKAAASLDITFGKLGRKALAYKMALLCGVVAIVAGSHLGELSMIQIANHWSGRGERAAQFKATLPVRIAA